MDPNEFEKWLVENAFMGYWQRVASARGSQESRTGEDEERTGRGKGRNNLAPRVGFRPYLWKWSKMAVALEGAGELIGPEDSFRRNVGYIHPDLGHGLCHTIGIGVQYVKPGEHPLAHHHNFGAMRFGVQGDGTTSTIVNGEAFPLAAGDLVTTPSTSWHDHENRGEVSTMWLDITDTRVVGFLRLMRSELHFDVHGKHVQDVSHPSGAWAAKAGVMRPTWLKYDSQPPPYRYPWTETQRLLDLLAGESGDPFDGICLRYLNPITGGPTIPTLSCEMQMLRPGDATRSHRHTSTVAYHAFRGCGRTAVDDETFEWETGDTFVVPAWSSHRHQNPSKEPAYLFSVSDRPIIEGLGLYREEAV